jgi:SAM-dependent methyltransferase
MRPVERGAPFGPEYLGNFRRGVQENPRFWARFGRQPALADATVLDVGSGWGSLCVDMARAGARRVVGLDLKQDLVDFANAYVREAHPDLAGRVSFHAVDLQVYAEPLAFDLIVSKDSFEHIIDLDGMLAAMRARLKPGGRLYAGFGPLYPTPYGDHDRRATIFRHWGAFGRLLALIPWGHLFLGPLMVATYNRRHQPPITSLRDLGLSMRALSDYRRAFQASGLAVVDFRTNQAASLQSRLFTALRRGLPFLEDYLTHNLYCILENRESA